MIFNMGTDPFGVINSEKYNHDSGGLNNKLHAKTENTSLLRFNLDYLFANPKYGIQKISDYRKV